MSVWVLLLIWRRITCAQAWDQAGPVHRLQDQRARPWSLPVRGGSYKSDSSLALISTYLSYLRCRGAIRRKTRAASFPEHIEPKDILFNLSVELKRASSTHCSPFETQKRVRRTTVLEREMRIPQSCGANGRVIPIARTSRTLPFEAEADAFNITSTSLEKIRTTKNTESGCNHMIPRPPIKVYMAVRINSLIGKRAAPLVWTFLKAIRFRNR